MAQKNTNPRTKQGPTWHYKYPMEMLSFASSCLRQSSENPTPSSQYGTGGSCSPQPGLPNPDIHALGPTVSEKVFMLSQGELRPPSSDIPQTHPITPAVLLCFCFTACKHIQGYFCDRNPQPLLHDRGAALRQV